MLSHSFLEPRAALQGVFTQLLVAEFQARHFVVLKQLQNLALLCAKQALFVLDMGRKHDVVPGLFAIFRFGMLAFLEISESAEYLAGTAIGDLKLSVKPRGNAVHGQVKCPEIKIPPYFGVEQK